jgi:subtilisin family serine protease
MTRSLRVLVLVFAFVACQDSARLMGPDAALPHSVDIRGLSGGPSDMLVVLREDASTDEVARDHGLHLARRYNRVMNGFMVRVPESVRQKLLADVRVESVEPDVAVRSADTVSAASWGLDRIDQRALPLSGTYARGRTGAGVTIYIVDTGIRYTHDQFGGRAAAGFDLFGGDGSDCNGHGTAVAGTAAGRTLGVAPDARIVSVRAMDCTGSGSVSGVVAGLDWIAGNAVGPSVVNLSLSGPTSNSLDGAVRKLVRLGIVVSVSAGNSGADACGYSPARAADAITTGASDRSDNRSSWSNWGDCVDWFAPGSGITTASYAGDAMTRTVSGTSIASPHTAGVAALYLEARPTASPHEVRDALFAIATKSMIGSAKSANNHLLYSGSGASSGESQPNVPPAARFAASCADRTCTFTDQSNDADGPIAIWRWEFGDGAGAQERDPVHQFGADGMYTVRLTVTDTAGASATTSAAMSVSTSAISLQASGYIARGTGYADLRWTGATGSGVDIYRNGRLLLSHANDGSYTDSFKLRGVSSAVYRVCEQGSTVCSADRTVIF